jgi:hypothetical protein
MFTRTRVPSRLVAAARIPTTSDTGEVFVEMTTLPSVVALGAPIRMGILFERDDGERGMMRVASLRFGESWIPFDEISAPWCAPWLATLAAALGVEARRRRASN